MKAKKASTPKQLTPQEVQREEDKKRRSDARRIRLGSDARELRPKLIGPGHFEELETALFSLEGLPEPGLEVGDVPRKLRTITQEELEGYENAEENYRIAKADLERKHGNLALRLLLFCNVEDGEIEARLDEDGRIVLKHSHDASTVPTTDPFTITTRS